VTHAAKPKPTASTVPQHNARARRGKRFNLMT
jgi:hypothetical protein